MATAQCGDAASRGSGPQARIEYYPDPAFAESLVPPMLCLLGSPAIREKGDLAPLRVRPKALAVLARVALADHPVPRGSLARQVFGDADDPRASLRWHLNHLRRRLPEPVASGLRADGDALCLDEPVDAIEFAAGAQRVIAEPDCADALGILALYRGDLCEGLTVAASPMFDSWLYAEQERLRRDFRRATLAFADRAVGRGHGSEAVEPLARLVAVEPYFEDGHLLLIRSLEQAGRQQAASAAYRRYERILREDLHASPDPDVAARYGRATALAGSGGRLPADRFVALEHVTLHIVEWAGDGPPILLVHGSGMSAYSMSALAQRLAPDLHVVAMDLRGSGFSDKPPSGYSLEVHAADASALVTELGLDRPILLGFSIGGAVTTLAANRIPARGLILLEGIVGPEAFVRNAAAQVIRPLGRFYDLDFGGFDEYLREWRGELAEFSSEAERLVEAMMRFELAPVGRSRVRHRGIRAALEETWLSAAEVDTLGELSRVACPTLVVHAAQPWIDGRPYLDDAIIEQQMRAARHGRLFVAAESNHPELARDPTPELVEAIRLFVKALA